MSSFKKTYVAPFSRRSAPLSADVLYWKQLTAPIFLKEINLIENIDISPIEPHFIAVTCSSRIQLYHPITRMVHKNYNRFKEGAYGGIFRNDGKLLLAGSEESALKLFDVSSKNLLRVFKGHQRAVHGCNFVPSENQIVSFSDDKIVGLWDMPSEALLHKFEGHTDYVRCGGVVECNSNLIISGSYDHSVKLWDKREKKEILNINHGSPVEAVLSTPNGSLLFTAGGTEICVWDCLSGGRLLAKISEHHKTVTCLKFGSSNKRLLSASLDKHVKIYEMSNYKLLHTLSYSSPILSLGISKGDKTLVVGMTDGIIGVCRMEESDSCQIEKITNKRKKSKAFSSFVLTDFGIGIEESDRAFKYDENLRKFRYSKALDNVMSDNICYKFPGTAVALFQQLIRRDGLKTAVGGRSGRSLSRIIRFLIRHLRRPRYMRICTHVSHLLLDIYGSKIGEDPGIDNLFLTLCEEVKNEINFMIDINEFKGAVEVVLAGSQMSENSQIGSPTHSSLIDKTQSHHLSSNKFEPSENAKQAVVVSIR